MLKVAEEIIIGAYKGMLFVASFSVTYYLMKQAFLCGC